MEANIAIISCNNNNSGYKAINGIEANIHMIYELTSYCKLVHYKENCT